MNNLTESEIEEIIYKSPWLLDERFIIPNILGSRKEKGRQINIGCNDNRYIDLLFKDTRDNRPVIVELKKESLNRDAIAQILEYRGYINLLNDERKEEWEEEFGINYFCPKMILIGKTVDEATLIAANLAGVEIRLFENEENSDHCISFENIITKLDEWNSFRKSGNRTLVERDDWVSDIVDRTNEVLNENFEFLSTIKSPAKVTNRTGFFERNFPFLNIPIRKNDENIIGIYEYYDDNLPFDEYFIYCDLERDIEEFDIEKFNFFTENGFEIISPYGQLILKVPRKILDDENEYESFLSHIIDIYNEIEEEE
nr:hypothetical protein [uncultured Carboxylicivirga sp.]